MKAFKKAIALVLCLVMTVGIFAVSGITVDDIANLFKAEAAITLGGITQQQVDVSRNGKDRDTLYKEYQNRFFTGSESNEPTNFVIPGLAQSDDYIPQGMTYWEEKEWILISAYDNSGTGKHSVIYAIDAVTTDFVALFKILNADGSVNKSHGGGIAASKYNFYYADTGSNISYFPLSEMDVSNGTVKEIKLRGSINCGGELGGAATSYCCYEDGVLWAGNFYYSGDDSYKTSAHSASDSMIVGYRLHGNSSAEEWYYLSTNYNLIKLNTDSTADQTSGTMTFRTYNTDGANAEIRGTVANNTGATLGEATFNFCSMSLTEGKKYKIEFIADNNLSDLYMFSPAGTHCNVKQSTATTITQLPNGKYHYQMIFTAGLKPTGADSSWPTTQSTNGTYTGTYTMRFDQDSVPAGGRTFNMTDISVSEYVEPNGFTPDSQYEGTGCAGNPTYVVMIAGIDKIQYAMVYKGKFYISRSWKRTSGDNHSRELMIGDIDLNSPGTSNLSINGRTRPCHMINLNNVSRFGGDNGSSNLNQMLYMGEALCVMNDFLYMFGEGAAWKYNGKESSICDEPIDVIWKIDQHMIMGEERTYDDTAPQYYEKVNSLSEINLNDDYIIVHESPVKDPVTQKNILYAFDSYGGYGANKLPKQDAGTQANSADSMGMVGYEIKDYSIDTLDNGKQILYLPEEVDTTKSLHWQIQGAGSGNLRINNKDLYYAKNNHLYFGSRLFAMTTDARTNLDKIVLEQYKDGDGKTYPGDFRIYYTGDSNYYLWCNDGSNQNLINTYTDYYSNHGKSDYVPQYHGVEELAGTFHADADAVKDVNNSGNLTRATVGVDMQIIHIYKRVADPYSSAYETRVSTDLKAELQADGTYNIKMETYAVSELQFQTVQKRPTDFIFVLDASGSMTNNNDARGYHTELNNWSDLKMEQAANSGDIAENSNYNREWTSNFYYKLPDGEFARISVAVNKGPDGKYSRDIWLWCKHPVTGRCYKLSQNGYLVVNNCTGNPSTDSASRITDAMFLANPSGYGYANASEIISEANSDKNRTDYHNSRNSKDKRREYGVMKYKYTNDYGDTRASYYSYGDCSRLLAMQNAVEKLTYKIADESAKTGMNHRIAIVQYGSDSNESYLNNGMYTTDGVGMVQYSGEGSIPAATYKKAFYDTSNFATVRRIIGNIVTWNGDPDTYSNYGFDMANNIVKNYSGGYLADGDRSACIIMITDGIPGVGNNSGVANTVANAAIEKAYQAKHSGAYVYTVQMGQNSLSGFDMDKYMDYVSSEFIYAESMTNPGDRNTKDIAYQIDVPTGSTFNIDNLANAVFESVTSNSTNAIATLNANSILREHLTDAFVIPSDAKTTIQVAKHNYDGLGRLYFEDPTTASGITANLDRATNEITVTGYDYSTRYVAKSNVGKGDKLIVTISGVIANADAELLNTSINQTGTTAIYQNNSFMAKNSAVKQFPTEHFTIPEYTYYMDYDIPMYDSDINGTLCSVDSTLKKQSNYKNELSTGNMGIKFMNGNQDMIYTLNSQAGLDEKLSKGYVLIKRDDGTYDWFRLNIVPASTVYYEENKTDILDGTQSFKEWTQSGSFDGKYQSLSTRNDVFGNDPTYSNSTDKFSLGTHKEVTVTASDKRSDTQSFTFTGTGFDLISACGPNTGIQTVTVKKHLDDGTQKIIKVYMVDTFYNDSTYNTVYQVPIVQFKGAYFDDAIYPPEKEHLRGHGTYTVETTAAYYSFAGGLKTQSVDTYEVEGTDIEATTAVADTFSTDELFAQVGMDELIGQEVELIWMDEDSVLNGGLGVEGATLYTQAGETTSTPKLVNYLDGFRIYNPNTYNDEYIDSEKNASFYSVIDTITAGDMGGDSFAGYLEGGTEGTVFGDYLTSGGPKYEVYLKPGKSIAFSFKADNSSRRAMISLRSASGEPKATVGASGAANRKTFTVNSASETYYDITNYLGSGSDGKYTVTITNDGSGLLAVDNIKITNASLVPLSGISLAELDQILSTQAVEIDASSFSVANTESKYSNYIPQSYAPESDPGLDEEGEIPDYVHDNTNKNFLIIEMLKSFIERIIAFFKNAFQSVSLDWLFSL